MVRKIGTALLRKLSVGMLRSSSELSRLALGIRRAAGKTESEGDMANNDDAPEFKLLMGSLQNHEGLSIFIQNIVAEFIQRHKGESRPEGIIAMLLVHAATICEMTGGDKGVFVRAADGVWDKMAAQPNRPMPHFHGVTSRGGSA